MKAEIFSSDSRQLYKEMSIGTAKPSTEELNEIKHHFINHISIHQTYSVGDYEREIIEKLKAYFLTKDTAILCGGTGLYIKAVCEGLDHFPEIPSIIRQKVRDEFEDTGLVNLLEELKVKDPAFYKETDHSNHRRILRAIEVIRSSNQPFSHFRRKEIENRPFDIEGYVLTRPRTILYERINKRVDMMMDEGLLDEVQGLYEYKDLPALQTVGYQELFAYLDGNMKLDLAVEKIKQNSRRYAKRQMTWFRNQTQFPLLEIN